MRVIIAREAGAGRDELRQVVLGHGLRCEQRDCVTHEELPVRLLEAPAGLVLVGLNGHLNGDLDLLREAAAGTRAPVLAVGPARRAEQILEVMRSGAREYLNEHRLGEDLLPVLARL